MQTHETQFHRHRKFLLILPLLVLPFLTMAFWALGGGKGTSQAGMTSNTPKGGLNLQLPEPHFKEEKYLSKLGLYNQVQREARKLKDAKSPTLLQKIGLSEKEGEHDTTTADEEISLAAPDPNEEQVNQRLAQLSSMMRQSPAPATAKTKAAATSTPPESKSRLSQDVAKMEALMRTMGSTKAEQRPDPEIQQIEGVLERILDIQHPDRVMKRLQEQSREQNQQAFPVQAVAGQAPVTLLTPAGLSSQGFSPYTNSNPFETHESIQNSFYELDDGPNSETTRTTRNSITAAIHETQTVVTGGLVRMRLLQEVSLGEEVLPKGSLVYGTCRVSGERLFIHIKSLQTRNTILPVSLATYDLDGLEGLYIPGSITRDVARQSINRPISQQLQLATLQTSVGTQVAGAGITAAQDLLSRKSRQVKITVKAGYRLLLRDQRMQP